MTKLTGHLLVSFLSNLLTGTLTDNSADIMRVCVCVIMTQTSGRTVPTVLIKHEPKLLAVLHFLS